MTREQARRRKRRKRKIQKVAAWTIFYGVELILSLAPAALLMAILLPMVYRDRGYFAFGGEWLAISIMFCTTFKAVNDWFYDMIFGEEV